MKIKRKLILLLFIISVLIIAQTGCGEKAEPISKQSYYLDTLCQISIYDMKDMSDENAGKAIDKAFALCNEYESLLSKTKEGTDVYKINHAKGDAVKCDPRTIEVIKAGIKYGDLSDGKFDITIGKVTDLWDFHAENPKVPSKSAINSALKCVDYKQIKISGNEVSMTNPNGEIDLGGIAKGYIGDKLTECLEKDGVTSAIISLGGNIITIGNKGGEDFSVGIEKPYSDMSEIIGSVKASDATVVTSGIYERYFEVDGVKYHHILDVKTGYPSDTDVEGVSLVSTKGHSVDCDALSTICLMLGVDEGKKLIEKTDGVEALFIDKDGNISKTDGFKLEK